MAQIPANLTNEAYKAKLRKVVEEGRARLDKARQAAQAHLASQATLPGGSTTADDGGSGDG